jgi:hypothetical protein
LPPLSRGDRNQWFDDVVAQNGPIRRRNPEVMADRRDF